MRTLFLIVWALFAGVLCWRAYDTKSLAIEQGILARSTEAVRAVSPSAEVLVDGRFVTVRGPQPDAAAKAATLAAANVWGALGPIDGLWVSQASSTGDMILAEKKPDGTLVLSGMVSGDKARAEVETAAKASFAGSIDNQLAVAENSQPAIEGLADAMKALAALDGGALVATPQRFQLFGTTANQEQAEAVQALASATPDRWQVYVTGPTIAAARLIASKTPDGSIITSGEMPSDEARAALLDALRGGDPSREIVDRMTAKEDGLPNDWSARAVAGAKALTDLDWGQLSLEGGKSYLRGMAAPGGVGAVGDALGAAFTVELIPRPADPDSARIAALERDLDAARSRVSDLSAAAAKHIADLDGAQARLAQMEDASAKIAAELDTAKQQAADLQAEGAGATRAVAAANARIAALESQAQKSKADLEAANSRIAGLLEMLTLRPVDPDPPAADALPAPPLSEAMAPPVAAAPAPPTPEPVVTPQPDTLPPAADTLEPPVYTPEPAAPADALAAPQVQAAIPPVEPPAQPRPSTAAQVAEACNASMAGVLKGATITFESKSAQITPEGNAVLDRLVTEAARCIGNPALKVTVGGHTDSRGRDRDNLKLSRERADSVKESLIVRSVPPEAITAIGYGETLPIADNATDEGRAVNRRITLEWSIR